MFAEQPVAIIDIGSNSVRLVVYSGATRIPSVIFNEKVMAGLGRGVGETGAIAPRGARRARSPRCERFRLLVRQMERGPHPHRRHRRGARGLERRRLPRRASAALGFDPRILSGEEEGKRAGQGVLSAIPDADGIVGDLGGGSLELVEVAGGQRARSASLPLGVLRLDALAAKGEVSPRRSPRRSPAAGFEGAAAGGPSTWSAAAGARWRGSTWR